MRRGIFWAAVVLATVRSASAQQIIDRDTTLDQFTSIFAGPIWIVDGPTGPTTVEMVDGADIGSSIHVLGHSVLNIRGGSTGDSVYAHESATVNMYAGRPALGEDIVVTGGVFNFYGGFFDDDIHAGGDGVANIYGGTFVKANDGAMISVGRNGVANVFLRSYEILPPQSPGNPYDRDALVGVLSDGSPIHVELWVQPTSLGSAEIRLHVVPEPQSLALGMIGMVLAGIVWRLPTAAGPVIHYVGDTPFRVVDIYWAYADNHV